MNKPPLLDIRNFVETTVGGHWVIAGGAARDQLLGREPRDIDMFGLQMKGLWKDVCQRLRTANVAFSLASKSYGQGHSNDFDPCIRLFVLGHEVNLVPTPCLDAESIVKTFDFNICRFYFEDDLCRIESSLDTDVSELFQRQMRLMHTFTPLSSLRRGFLFEHRLGMPFIPTDIEKLVNVLSTSGNYSA